MAPRRSEENLRFRIALWGTLGLLVAGFWALYFFPTAANMIAYQPAVWALALFSCPMFLACTHFGFAISVDSVLIANAVTYALIGLLVELVRRRSQAAA
jgi:hypothetical protein